MRHRSISLIHKIERKTVYWHQHLQGIHYGIKRIHIRGDMVEPEQAFGKRFQMMGIHDSLDYRCDVTRAPPHTARAKILNLQETLVKILLDAHRTRNFTD